MIRGLLLLVVLMLAMPARAQGMASDYVQSSSTFATAQGVCGTVGAGVLMINTEQRASGMIDVAGVTGEGFLGFYGSINGNDFFPVIAYPVQGGPPVAFTSGNGRFRLPLGFKVLCVAITNLGALTAATVVLSTSTAPFLIPQPLSASPPPIVPVVVVAGPPINSLIIKCNAVRKTSCQP